MQEHGSLGLSIAQTLEGLENLSYSSIRVGKLYSWPNMTPKNIRFLGFLYVCFALLYKFKG